MSPKTVFLTGASGYIGGRLVARLLASGHRVRCLVRDPRKLEGRAWALNPWLEIVEGDAEDVAGMSAAMQGCGPAYYLIHSMLAVGPEYRDRDRGLAEKFARAAASAGIERIIYLGGLGETGEGLSEHLTSRREVEAALAAHGTPVTVLRAAMIIGSGSASFEILRYLVERLPIMVTPKWVATECQPIAIKNVLFYLTACLGCEETVGKTLDIGGAEVKSYRDIMQDMASCLGIRRRIIFAVPVLTPRLSSLWIHFVTPVSHLIARPLAEGLRNRVVCRNDDAARLLPQPLLSIREAITEALGRESKNDVETAWSDAGPMPGDPEWSGGKVFVDRRSVIVAAPPESTFRAVCRIGGGQGYYAADSLWRIRGWMDHMIGGPGLRRGRRNHETIAYGDALDFWRVTGIEKNRRLELRAEMKLPGIAELAFETLPAATGGTELVQIARFKPRGLLGLVYWYSILPLHGIVFRGMLGGIKRAAESETARGSDAAR